MVIMGNDINEVAKAMAMVIDDPHPDHMREEVLARDWGRAIEDMINDSMQASSIIGCSIRDDAAMIGGVLPGMIRHQIWMLASRKATDHPVWMMREAKKNLHDIDVYIGWPASLYQYIPVDYVQGVDFAKHLGFKPGRVDDGHMCKMLEMERMVKSWAR